MKDLTVAICAYNCEKYIKETLECIVNQSCQDFDLVIVNDCSTDNTRELALKFLNENDRQYRLIDFEINKGLAAGRSYIENNVKTKYIIFVDADDCPCPNMVEKLYNKITSDKDFIVVGCYLEFIDSRGNKISGGQFLGDKSKEDFYLRAKNGKLIFLASNAIFNREIANSVGGRAISGFFDGYPRYQDLCEDLDLWTRMSDKYVDGGAIVVIPEVLLKYRKHEQGLSASSFNMMVRMRHIKSNLLLRRSGRLELTFIDFFNSLSDKDVAYLKRKSAAADSLRNCIFLLKKGNIFKASSELLKSIFADPQYLWQKVKSNSGYFK